MWVIILLTAASLSAEKCYTENDLRSFGCEIACKKSSNDGGYFDGTRCACIRYRDYEEITDRTIELPKRQKGRGIISNTADKPVNWLESSY